MISARMAGAVGLVGILAGVMLAGCGTTTVGGRVGSDEALRRLQAGYDEENQRQQEALGERTYEKDFDEVFTGVVTGFADIRYSVWTVDRQSGYVLAQGASPLPLEKEAEFCRADIDAINHADNGGWTPWVGHATYSVAVNVVRMGVKKTKVSLHLFIASVHGEADRNTYYGIYPPLNEAMYAAVWGALEKRMGVTKGNAGP